MFAHFYLAAFHGLKNASVGLLLIFLFQSCIARLQYGQNYSLRLTFLLRVIWDQSLDPIVKNLPKMLLYKSNTLNSNFQQLFKDIFQAYV